MEINRTSHETLPPPAPAPPEASPPQDIPTEDGFSAALEHSLRHYNGEEEPPEEPPDETEPAATTPPARRFASQEEAERAHREAEQRMHQSTQEAAALRRHVEQVELRLRELETSRPQEQPPSAAPPTQINIRERLKAAYTEASNLDPDADNYYQRQQDILVNAQAEILENLLSSTRLTEEQISQRIQQGVQQAQADWQRQTQQQTDAQRQTQKLLDAATAAGLDVRPPPDDGRGFAGLHYNDLMFAVANDMYPADATEDQAIAHVVTLIRERWGVSTPGATNHAANGATPPQTPSTTPTHAPLERSGMGRPAVSPQQAQPMSMSEAIDATLRPRRP